MKTVKQIFYILLFLTDTILTFLYADIIPSYFSEEGAVFFSDSSFIYAKQLYISYLCILVITMVLVLIFSLIKLKSAPKISFLLLGIPILLFIADSIYFILQHSRWRFNSLTELAYPHISESIKNRDMFN